MSQYLTNIGKVETAGVANISVGAVSATLISPLIAGTAMIGSANIFGGGGFISIYNTAGLVISVANTGGAYTLANGTGLIGTANIVGSVNVSNTGGTVAAYQSGSWAVNITNSAGWLINILNTGGSVIISNGTALIGSANVAVYGAVSSTIINAHTATVVNAVSAKLIAGAFLVGSARVLFYGANSVNLTAGVASIGTVSAIIMNTSNWTTDTTLESVKMSSSGQDVYSYSSVIECSLTNNLIIAASANRIFKILGYTLMAGVANNAIFQSGSNSTELETGTHFFGASGGIVVPYNPMGWFSVTAGSPLYLKLATANSVGGVISYLVM